MNCASDNPFADPNPEIVPEVVAEATAAIATPPRETPRWLRLVDMLTDRGSEWLSPILVKEARQSLKSMQFTITFSLLLICCWVWTILGLAMLGSEARYAAVGGSMFVGYYLILAFPLTVIVPFGAFRSLASEQEDRTYELMCISTLRPTRIVIGKLGSAMLQMVLYLSAVSPCLAFTYMLRGLALPNIFMTLLYTVLVSVGLSLIALLLSTLSNQRHWQVMISVFLIVGLLFAFYFLMMAMFLGELVTSMPFYDDNFWVVNAMLLTGYITYFALVFYATVARITFASDNRSTRLRVVMLIQHLCLIGWFAWFWIAENEHDQDIISACLCFLAAHWYVMGALMSGESVHLSLRVRRNLPTSFLGRVFLTWFNPGPGTGYLFAICGSIGGLVFAAFAIAWLAIFSDTPFSAWQSPSEVLIIGTMLVCYLTIYLGVGLLILRLLRRWGLANPFLALIIQAVLLALGILAPLVIDLAITGTEPDFSLLQISNPFWTTVELCDYGSVMPGELPWVLLILVVAAIGLFLIHLPSIVREVRYVRIAQPARVVEDDLAATSG